MSEHIIHSKVAPGVSYSRQSNIVYQTNVKTHHKTKISDEKKDLNTKLLYWGTDNLFPQKILKEARKNTVIGPTIGKKAEIATAPIEYGLIENGKFVPKNGSDPEVDAFMRRSRLTRYSLSFFRNFYYFYNAFPDLVFTVDKSKVYSISCNLKTAHCRYGAPENGELTKVFINPDWENETYKHKNTQELPVIPMFGDPEAIRQDQNNHRYVFPSSYPTEDENAYSLADWNAVRKSGWLAVAQAIPEFKKALFDNQITIKYLITIPTWWWDTFYPGFQDMDMQEKKKIMDEELDNFETFMKGNSNSGNSMITTKYVDPESNKSYEGWEIQAIDNKIKDGIYIEDSNEAVSHILYALGIHDSILGTKPGKNLGAGSGSDMRVAYNLYHEQVTVHQDFALEPFYWIQEYNGWTNYEWRYKNRQAEQPESKNPLNEPQQQAS